MFLNKARFSLAIFLALALAACSQLAIPASTPTLAPTATSPPTSTPEPTATTTPTPTETLVPTATPDLEATASAATQEAKIATQNAAKTAAAVAAQETQQVEDAQWAQLVEDGAITYTKGRLYQAEDFEASWAQRDWYRWWPFDYNLADFVISTHIEWESAQDANLAYGGCGFVLRIQDSENHLVLFLTTSNEAELGQMTPRGYQYLNTNAWINKDLEKIIATKGSADLIVAAEQEKITAYIDGVKAYKWVVARTNKGDMGYTIISGTNKDFGTYCLMTNTRIWELVK